MNAFRTCDSQERQSAALSAYFNKTDEPSDDDDGDDTKAPWDDMKSNDWGDTQQLDEEHWDDFSTPAPASVVPKGTAKTTTTTTTNANTASSWVQDKPSPSSQPKNDWDSDAFFNDVLSTSNKPKLKTSRR